MLHFFRINVPDRIIALISILVLIRLPYLLYGTPLTMPELTWQLAAEKLSGGALLYRDLQTDLGLIPAYTYTLLFFFFGKVQWPLQVSAAVLTLIQALQLHRMAVRFDIFPERGYLPSFIYILISSWFYQFLTAGPALLASVFIIAAAGKTFQHLRPGLKEDELLLPGFYTALAALCYPSAALFILVPLLAFLLYTGTTARQYVLIIFSFILPFLLTGLVYYFAGSPSDFFFSYLFTPFTLNPVTYLTGLHLAVLFAVPALYLFFALLRLRHVPRITNFQQNGLAVMVFWLLASGAGAYFANYRSAGPYYLLAAPFSLLLTWFYLLQKRTWTAELSINMLLFSALACLYLSPFAGKAQEDYFSAKNLTVPANAGEGFPKGKKILVLGNNLSLYRYNSLATPYLNRELANRDFSRLDEYEGAITIYNNFRNDYPEYIINDDGSLDSVFSRIPALARCYAPERNRKIFRYTGP